MAIDVSSLEAARGIYRTATVSLPRGPRQRVTERRLAINFEALGIQDLRRDIIDGLLKAGCEFAPRKGWLDWVNRLRVRPKFEYCATVEMFPWYVSCSSWIKGLHGLWGIQIGQSLEEQMTEGIPVPLEPDYSNVREGDIIFKRGSLAEFEIAIFGERGPENAVVHAGIATGRGTVLHIRGRGEDPGLEEIPLPDFVKPANAEVRRYVTDWNQVEIFTLSDSICWERSTDARTTFVRARADELRQRHYAPPERIFLKGA